MKILRHSLYLWLAVVLTGAWCRFYLRDSRGHALNPLSRYVEPAWVDELSVPLRMCAIYALSVCAMFVLKLPASYDHAVEESCVILTKSGGMGIGRQSQVRLTPK